MIRATQATALIRPTPLSSIAIYRAIPECITHAEQARYNYRALQSVLGGHGWKQDGREVTLCLGVDHRGLLTRSPAPHKCVITAIGDRWGWIVASMSVDLDGAAADWFRRSAVSIQPPETSIMISSWDYMSAPRAITSAA